MFKEKKMLTILIWSLHAIYLEIIAVLHKYVHLFKKKSSQFSGEGK